MPQTEKKDKLIELLRLDIEKYEKREEEPYTKKTLVFVERKRTADVVASFLSQESLPAISIHGSVCFFAGFVTASFQRSRSAVARRSAADVHFGRVSGAGGDGRRRSRPGHQRRRPRA